MLNAKLLRSYISKNKTKTFVYSVDGSKENLEAFAEAQGEYLRTDEVTGKYLYFTTRPFGMMGKLLITSNGNIVPDTTELDMAQSMTEAYGGNFGQSIGQMFLTSIMAKQGQVPISQNPSIEEGSIEEGGSGDIPF